MGRVEPGALGYPFVNVMLGDLDVSFEDVRGSKRPLSLLSFTYNRTMLNAGNKVSLVLFDREETFIERAIAENYLDLRFRYGWVRPDGSSHLTNMVTCAVLDYTPTFQVGGTEIALEAVTTFVARGTQRSKEHRGRISDVVRTIAEDNGWNHQIDRTTVVTNNSGDRETGRSEPVFQQTNQTDFNFILDLKKQAVRESDNKGYYTAYFNDTEQVLHFHPPRVTGDDVSRVYVRRGNLKTQNNVISFSPSIQGQLAGILGAYSAETPYTDSVTGAEGVTRVSVEDGESTGMGDASVTNAGSSTVSSPSDSEASAGVLASNRFETLFNQVNKAEMEVIGDPFIPVGSLVDVQVFYRNGQRAYVSGRYFVTEVEDTISGGTFTSQLSMVKNAFRARKLPSAFGADGNNGSSGNNNSGSSFVESGQRGENDPPESTYHRNFDGYDFDSDESEQGIDYRYRDRE